MEQSVNVLAPAKINLLLHVLGRRQDGYHELDSVMAKLDLADELKLTKLDQGIALRCPGSELAGDQTNLAWRAAKATLDHCGLRSGVSITLTKNIPVAAGLGGGSSDAAAVIRGVCQLYGCQLNRHELIDLGVRLGADVPFFLVEENTARARGIGEKLEPVIFREKLLVVLANPGFAVSTKWVFDSFALTSMGNPFILARERPWTQGNGVFGRPEIAEISNDLEAVTCARFPQISSIKKKMLQFGALASLMTGSGPTVFGLFDDRKLAQSCYMALAAENGMRAFLTEIREDR